MVKSGGLLALALLVLPVGSRADEPAERESEYEMPAAEAWALPGFRVQLRFGRDWLTGDDGLAPDTSGDSFSVEPGIRLSSAFSISATLRYAALVDGFTGVRYSTSGEAAWHPYDGFFLAGGIGYAGLVGSSFLQDCDGDGVLLLARTGWLLAAGEIFATGPVVQLDEQWTWCGRRSSFDDTNGVWRHRSLHFSWSLAWR
jgi:hypothetical protein